ncbi:carbohydrate kinase family protein [Patescibacteria group bacterium]|nr:carbohydrate kinase family protein [Patescibacteria group bacterium]
MRILISGSIAYDRIMDFPGKFEDHIIPSEIRQLNVSFTVKEFRETFGGNAGNIAYSLSLLEEKPVVYSAVGKDFQKYQERFNQLGIDISGIKIYPQTLTASAYIITDKNDNQITGFFPGAMSFYAKKPKVAKGDLAIISPSNPNEMLDLADFYHSRQIPFIFDPGQQIIQFTKNQLRKVIKLASICVVNDYELALTQKITNYDKTVVLQSAGILITTLGKQGSLIEINQHNKLERINISAVKTTLAKDPTGGGDAYRAGLIKGLVASRLNLITDSYFKFPWLEIGQSASLAAVYAIEHYGTQNHFYTYNQFKKRYQLNYKSSLTF